MNGPVLCKNEKLRELNINKCYVAGLSVYETMEERSGLKPN